MSCKRIRLVVKDSADESSYVSVLEAAGYVLQIREPDWFEHRLFKGPDTDINLHVFSLGTSEIDRMLRFRDWLRTNEESPKCHHSGFSSDRCTDDWFCTYEQL